MSIQPLKFDVNLPDHTLPELMDYFHQHGDIFPVELTDNQGQGYVVSHPQYVEQVLATHYRRYTKGFGLDRVKVLLGNGIMTSEGEFWKKQRRMIQPAFRSQVLDHLQGSIQQTNQQLLKKWQTRWQADEAIDLTQDVSELALSFILKAIFSEDLAKLTGNQQANPFMLVSEESARNLEFARQFRALRKVVSQIIEARQQQQRLPFDLLTLLMQARDKASGEPMTSRCLLDEITTLVVAGHETTASALNWLWYLISQHPEVEAKLHQEVDSKGTHHIPTISELDNFPYAKQVILETLRLYPPGWMMTRRAINNDQLADYPVIPGDHIFISPYLIHRHPTFWQQPEVFRPERFANLEFNKLNRFAYIPFSRGPRNCIGEQLALYEMQIHLIFMARQFKLSTQSKQPIALDPQINLRTKYPLLMQLSKRH
jgi:cytochrome P450